MGLAKSGELTAPQNDIHSNNDDFQKKGFMVTSDDALVN